MFVHLFKKPSQIEMLNIIININCFDVYSIQENANINAYQDIQLWMLQKRSLILKSIILNAICRWYWILSEVFFWNFFAQDMFPWLRSFAVTCGPIWSNFFLYLFLYVYFLQNHLNMTILMFVKYFLCYTLMWSYIVILLLLPLDLTLFLLSHRIHYYTQLLWVCFLIHFMLCKWTLEEKGADI